MQDGSLKVEKHCSWQVLLKKDVSTMMLQEKELEKFNNQEGRSTGRGPTKAVRDARDRKQQIKMTEEFVKIF